MPMKFGRRVTDKHPALHYGSQIAAAAALLLLCWTTWSVHQLPVRNCAAQNQGREAIIGFITRQTMPALQHASPKKKAEIHAYLADAHRTFHPLNCATSYLP